MPGSSALPPIMWPGVWMGYDDNTTMAGVTGGGLPAEIWHEVMVRVEEGLPRKDRCR